MPRAPVLGLLILVLAAGNGEAGVGDPPTPGSSPGTSEAVAPDDDGCELARNEVRILERLRNHPEQSRQLTEFARMRAREMAREGYFAHVTPDRVGPNAQLKAFGYPLPDLYGGQLANSVESIAAGLTDVEVVWRELLASGPHRRHLLGQAESFREQDEIGIAHHQDPDSDYGDYWVIVIARRERLDEPRYLCTPEPAVCFEIAGGGR